MIDVISSDIKKNLIVLLLVIFIFFLIYSWTKPSQLSASEVLGDNYFSFYSLDEYEANISEYDVVLLNFYADWCGSCNGMESLILDVMSEVAYSNNITGYRVNFGDNTETPDAKILADKYGIATYSTILVLDGEGNIVGNFFGSIERDELRDALLLASRL